ELMNSVERGVVLARSDYICPKDLSFVQTEDGSNMGSNMEAGNTKLSQIEETAILSTLEAARGNKSETARRLGITRKTLLKKLKLYEER
ncbi:MAG: two-component system response regulator, partial [Desulfobacteraceae bacterium]|nr:two-component system response regulator [Desulfobacteraceae bacterium]